MRKSKRPAPWGTAIAFVILIGFVAFQKFGDTEKLGDSEPPPSSALQMPEKSATKTSSGTQSSGTKNAAVKTPSKYDGYEVFESCTLIDNRGNDGDSFHVRLPNGSDEELRLYFVDTPESYRHRYNGERISDQADYFNLSDDEVVEVGVDAKKFVLGLLAKKPFTVFTKWEEVYKSDRHYVFVKVDYDGKARWLHELLVDKGMVRIHTKGEKVPGGSYSGQREKSLRTREKKAQGNKVGAWGV